MQEVVKRLQEKQERQKEDKLPERVTLVIAKWQGKKYPVILPRPLYIELNDLVWFKPDNSDACVCGDILYVDDYCKPDDQIWTLTVIVTGMEPIRAIRYAHASDANWEVKENDTLA